MKILILLVLLLSGCEDDSVVFGMDLTKAVIHHTASHDVSAKEIDRWHKERGWDGIGYHFVIRKDGTVEKGRSLSKRGAHAKGRNDRIGIVLTGYDEFDSRQIDALNQLLSDLGIQNIERHHERCPGKGLKFYPPTKDSPPLLSRLSYGALRVGLGDLKGNYEKRRLRKKH